MKPDTSSSSVLRLSLVVAFAALAGCGGDGQEELRQWMDEVQRQTPKAVQKIPAPKVFTPFLYASRDQLDPYDAAKLGEALARQEAVANSGIRPDLDRRREPLESFPLDTITMVGTLERPGLKFALLRVDQTVFRAKVGNYVGQNFGRIVQVTDSEISLREIVRDASGEWTEREAKLELQESE